LIVELPKPRLAASDVPVAVGDDVEWVNPTLKLIPKVLLGVAVDVGVNAGIDAGILVVAFVAVVFTAELEIDVDG